MRPENEKPRYLCVTSTCTGSRYLSARSSEGLLTVAFALVTETNFVDSPEPQCRLPTLQGHDPGCGCGTTAHTDPGSKYSDLSLDQLQAGAEGPAGYLSPQGDAAHLWPPRQQVLAYSP